MKLTQTQYGKLPLVPTVDGQRVRLARDEQQAPATSFADPVRTAKAPVSPSDAQYRSKTEAAYAQFLEWEKQAGLLREYWYEPFSFRLANGKRYRVDFLVWRKDGTVEAIEVKGAYHKNRRDSLTHLVWASQRFPFLVWRLVWRMGQGWDGKFVAG